MNIKAVAQRAKVSTATVSRAMNGSAKVSPETAERVRKAIEALNFYPDTNARALGLSPTSQTHSSPSWSSPLRISLYTTGRKSSLRIRITTRNE
jgi:transcriptional regulator with XRE-family HTH domain